MKTANTGSFLQLVSKQIKCSVDFLVQSLEKCTMYIETVFSEQAEDGIKQLTLLLSAQAN